MERRHFVSFLNAQYLCFDAGFDNVQKEKLYYKVNFGVRESNLKLQMAYGYTLI